jgi:hypothetical protein
VGVGFWDSLIELRSMSVESARRAAVGSTLAALIALGGVLMLQVLDLFVTGQLSPLTLWLWGLFVLTWANAVDVRHAYWRLKDAQV